MAPIGCEDSQYMNDRLQRAVERRPVASFFVLAFAFTWTFNGIVIGLDMEPSWTAWGIGIVGTFGPTVAAAIVLWLTGGDLRTWFDQLLLWRVRPRWYVATLGIPLLILAGTTVAYVALGGPFDPAQAPAVSMLVIGLVLASIFGSFQEELGWRGFAQPVMQERYGALGASVLIGVVWGLWHLPLFFSPAAPHADWTLLNQVLYFPSIVAMSVILAWIYNGSGGSVLLVTLGHAAINAWTMLVPIDAEVAIVDGAVDEGVVTLLVVPQMSLLILVAVVIAAVFGRRLASGPIPGPERAGLD